MPCHNCAALAKEHYADSPALRRYAAANPGARLSLCPACIKGADSGGGSSISPGALVSPLGAAQGAPPPALGNTGVAGGGTYDSAGNWVSAPAPAPGTSSISPPALNVDDALKIANALKQFIPGLNVQGAPPAAAAPTPPPVKKDKSKQLRTLEIALVVGVVVIVVLAVARRRYSAAHAS